MIIIKVQNNISRFLNKCLANKINLYNIEYIDDYILVTINEQDLKTIKKLNYYSKIKFLRYTGKKKVLYTLKRNIYNILLLIVFTLLIYIFSQVIVKVEVKHENKEIINRVTELLEEKDIKPFTLKKSNRELNEISDKILEENRDFLDFISISNKGMTYVVNIEERILITEEKPKERCHVIAKKDGTITSIVAKSGVSLVEKGNLVKKGDILISGEIILNEEIKDNTCAEGDVRANTWYKVNIKYPLKEIKKEYTKREKVNLKIINKYLINRLYKEYEEKTLFKFKNLRLVYQKETKSTEFYLDKETVKEKAINEAVKKIKEKLPENSLIIDKKVLKESTNNSTIELDIFISVEESIGEMIEYEGRDKIDTNEGV